MQSDKIGLVFTYIIALVVIVGGGILLIIPSQVPPEQLLPFMTGIFGIVVGFVFNKETATGTARATERAVAAGVSSQPQVASSSGPPPTTTVTARNLAPPPPEERD